MTLVASARIREDRLLTPFVATRHFRVFPEGQRAAEAAGYPKLV